MVQGARIEGINFSFQNSPNSISLNNSPSEKTDDSRLSEISWDHRDSKLLRSYFQQCAKYEPTFADLPDLDPAKVQDFFISSGLASIRQDGKAYLTHAGVLFCCKQEKLPRSDFHVHVKFKNELTEELFGSILYLYDELYKRFKPLFQRRMGSPDIRDEYGAEKIFFEYPEVAIVEALANFLIHRDYSLDDRGFITVYPDRLEFINPGMSEIPINELENAKSELRPIYKRNQRLIEAMNKARINQAEGSGILRIRRELLTNQSISPDGSLGLFMENDENKNRFSLTIFKRVPSSQIPTVMSSFNTVRRLGSAPPLPSLVVGRKNDISKLKLLLSSDQGNDQTVITVRGWPGVGKTTLASVLAHDPEIAQLFPDGVLWVSLGQNPLILSNLSSWGRALGHDGMSDVRSIDEASALLRALLRDKRMLLIVDDVWEAKDAVPFGIGGRGCAMLLTTRLNSVAQALSLSSNNIYLLPVLSDEKAFELLKILVPDIVQKYNAETLKLIRQLEGLPLALQVAGRLLKAEASYGFGIEELVSELQTGRNILEAAAPPDRRDIINGTIPTVDVLLQKSIEVLDSVTQDCFAYLGVFAPKPATFDLSAMAAVWQIENPKLIVRTLVDRGLLEFIDGRYQMHSVLVMYAKSLLTDE
jgi:hypothetical protein